ncbi:MAG: metallophosphoesterase [Pseudomonadota bacterium]
MISRRQFLKIVGGGVIASAALSSYAFAIEPLYRLRLTTYRFTPPNWTAGLKLRVALIADVHACKPWMTIDRIEDIVARTNDLKPDLTLLLGDYGAGMNLVTDYVHSKDWAPVLGKLKASSGVYAVLGNHDWWEDKSAQRAGHGPTFGQVALQRAGVPVLENDAVRLVKDDKAFWIAGLGDQLALLPQARYGRRRWQGVDDLDGTLASITDTAPVLLMAHEPDIFPSVPDRVSVTMSGHTHGGQVRLFGYSPVVPSRFKNRYAYGHVVENGRHLIVSGGLGCSIAPIRFGSPPEIVVLELGDDAAV